MNNPYSVLGVSESDSDETIKQAYRELARKYHPDIYTNNPLSDLAQEKMKEINQAYDEIMAMRKDGAKNTEDGHYTQYTGKNAELYARIRQSISAGDIQSAEQLLNNFSIGERDAEWYFLMGSVFYKKGWYDEARSSYNTACSLDPENAEYRRAANQMNRTNTQYRQYRGGGMNTGGCFDCCTSLICADCLCECFGGNFCPCLGCR